MTPVLEGLLFLGPFSFSPPPYPTPHPCGRVHRFCRVKYFAVGRTRDEVPLGRRSLTQSADKSSTVPFGGT